MSFEAALQALSTGDELEAEKQLRRVCLAKRGPEEIGSAEFSLGLLLERQGRLDEAAECLERATLLKTDSMQRALSRKILAGVLSRIPGRETDAETVALAVATERRELLGDSLSSAGPEITGENCSLDRS